MKNILVIFTGGTIGSKIKDGWISPDKSTKYLLTENFEIANGKVCDFTCIEPYFLLSENLSGKELNILIKTVKENLDKDYDGIIITHGTDTLQFSAVAISYAVGNRTIPIMLVSANYPLEDERSNGNINFKAAIDFIINKAGSGVFIPYKNRGESLKFHRGLGVCGYREADDGVYSLYNRHYAEYNEGKICVCNNVCNVTEAMEFYLCNRPNILVVSAMPCDSFSYDINKYRAVILRSYHSGTLDTANSDFAAFCKKAKTLEIPIFAINIHNSTAYESAKVFTELSIIPLPDISFADAYLRLWIGISQNKNLKNLF